MSHIHEHTFNTGTVDINYAEIPSAGRPLVMLHGGSARWQSFGSSIDDLSDYHLYLPDLRGHGKSGRTPGHYRLQDYTDDMISFIKNCVARPVYLFGHSLGGIIALLVAAQYPEGVRAVAIGDSPLTGETWRQIMFMQTNDRVRAWQKKRPHSIPSR